MTGVGTGDRGHAGDRGWDRLGLARSDGHRAYAGTVAGGTVYFSNDRDRRLYRQDRTATDPHPITPDRAWRYADGTVDRLRGRWIGVREDHSDAAKTYPDNAIVSIDLNGPGNDPGRIVAAGHDFFSTPRLFDTFQVDPQARLLAEGRFNCLRKR